MATCVGSLVPAFRWMAIGWIVVFWRLGYASLLDPDEAHYAELTREMLHSGNWLVPLLDGKPFIDKPVLFHWLQGASVLLLGETEFAARLPTALAALGLFAMTRWVGACALRRRGRHAGARSCSRRSPRRLRCRPSRSSTWCSRCSCLAPSAVCWSRPRSSAKLELCGYGLLTLAVMTKGTRSHWSSWPLFVAVAFAASSETRGQVRELHWKIGLPAVAIAASPWFCGWDGDSARHS